MTKEVPPAGGWAAMRQRRPQPVAMSPQEQKLSVLAGRRKEVFTRLVAVDDFVEDCLRYERVANEVFTDQHQAELQGAMAQILTAWKHITLADRLIHLKRCSDPDLAELQVLLGACEACIDAGTPKTFRSYSSGQLVEAKPANSALPTELSQDVPAR